MSRADRQLAEKVVRLLNEMIALDRDAFSRLVRHREPCNEALADHPTIQVDASPAVGIVGVLNGLCGVGPDGWGAVAVVYDGDGNVLEATVLEERL